MIYSLFQAGIKKISFSCYYKQLNDIFCFIAIPIDTISHRLEVHFVILTNSLFDLGHIVEILGLNA